MLLSLKFGEPFKDVAAFDVLGDLYESVALSVQRLV